MAISMSSRLARALFEPIAALRHVLANRNLRRLCLVQVAVETGTPAFGVALYLFAFERGGAAAVGVVGLVTMLPAALVAPFAALAADRAPRERVLAAAAITRALLLGAIAGGAVLGVPAGTIYALAAVASLANRVFFPARVALLPSLTASQEELAAANAVTGTIENLGFVAGPAVAGIVVSLAGPAVAFALAALATLLAAGIATGIRPPREPSPARPGSRSVRRELVAGFRAIGGDRTLRLVIGLYTAATAAFGVVLVLVVGLAVEVLGIGEAGVGALNGALGVGGVAGGLVALGLAGRLRAGGDLTAGSLLFGLPLALVALLPHPIAALVLLGTAGAGGVVVDVACYTLVQQAASEEVRARVFGVLEGLAVGAVGLGSALGGFLATSVGVRSALLVAASIPLLGAVATITPARPMLGRVQEGNTRV
jgi:MFS family permease